MRDLHDSLLTGPVSGDIHRAALREAAEDSGRVPLSDANLRQRMGPTISEQLEPVDDTLTLPAKARALVARPIAGPTKPADGYFGQVHAGSANGAQRDSAASLPEVEIRSDGIHVPVSVAWQGVLWDVDTVYTAALRAMGPDPIPLTASEPWEESDEAYRKRLGWTNEAAVDRLRQTWGSDLKLVLDHAGDRRDLSRARLVPTQQEPRP